MDIDFNRFVEWAESRFEEVQVKGGEVRINSIFTDDDHFHLWLSPSGGKKHRKGGVYHCFKTDRKGSLISLVMQVDGCDYDEAISTLKGESALWILEKKLEEEFAEQDKKLVVKPTLALPPFAYLITNIPNQWWKQKALDYMKERAIPPDGYYFCTNGNYKGRIIIPYYDRNGKLIYWNARSIYPKSKLRYLGPPKELGVGKLDVVYMDSWPAIGSTIYLCEGEFNAKSLNIAGLNGAACGGKTMSEHQATVLKDYKVVICLDRDKPGWTGAASMSEKLSAISIHLGLKDRLLLCRPPEGFKDWNEMLIKLDKDILREYILKTQKPLEQNMPLGKSDLFFGLRDL